MYQTSFNESAENAFITFNVFLVFITPEALPLIYILKPLEEEGASAVVIFQWILSFEDKDGYIS